MTKTIKILISAIGIAAILGTPAFARKPVHYRALGARAQAGPVRGVPANAYAGARTGYRYSGPYDERIITAPNGIVLGTDPDASVRAYMRRDSGGAGGAGVSGNTGF
jgi:hypothetical protein